VLDKFELHKRVVVRELPTFRKVCMNFFFKANGKNDTIIFTKFDEIFELNFMDEKPEMKTFYKFEQPFKRQPSFFKPTLD